jgi:hypothetical protein
MHEKKYTVSPTLISVFVLKVSYFACVTIFTRDQQTIHFIRSRKSYIYEYKTFTGALARAVIGSNPLAGHIFVHMTTNLSFLSFICETNHSPPSSVEVKNEWSYTSTPQYVFMAWYFVKHRHTSTFTSKIRILNRISLVALSVVLASG